MEKLKNLKSKTSCSFVSSSGFTMAGEIKEEIRNQIRRWIRNTQDVLFFPGPTQYQAHFSNIPGSPGYQCYLKIRIGFRKWRAQAKGSNLFEALDRAFEFLSMKAEGQSPISILHYQQKVPSNNQLDKAG